MGGDSLCKWQVFKKKKKKKKKQQQKNKTNKNNVLIVQNNAANIVEQFKKFSSYVINSYT
jgi:phosphohistidine swiveling domain-containing protein